MISKYGYDVFFTVVTLCLVIIVVALIFVEPKAPRYVLIGLAFVVLGLTVNFFRDPLRNPPPGAYHIIAPADGKVIVVKPVEESEFFHSRAQLISIFMSPLDVHVNRNPVSGIVRYTRYVPGEYFAAFEDKASEKNEQMIVGIDNSLGKVLFKQIAGFIARRIVCTLKVGDTVTAGHRFGMIKFGSRVDVVIPADAAVQVKVGDRTVAGETVLADFRQVQQENR